jgi:hypothetical protein
MAGCADGAKPRTVNRKLCRTVVGNSPSPRCMNVQFLRNSILAIRCNSSLTASRCALYVFRNHN